MSDTTTSTMLPGHARHGLLRKAQAADVWIILAAMFALSVIWVPNFSSEFNLGNLLAQCSVLGIVAIAQFLVVANGEFDLSVGALLAACSVAFVVTADHGLMIGVLAALGVGFFIGLLNGVMVTYGRIPSLIVTLATLSISRGLAFAMTETAIPNPDPTLAAFARIWYGAVPASALVWFALVLIVGGVLWFTGLRTHILAIGSNAATARAAGVSVTRIKIGVFVASGLLVAIAAILFVARTRSGIPQGGTGLELQSIAAIVIGGTRLFGGQGSLAKAMAGVLIFVMIRNVLGLLGVHPFVVDLVIALIILLAVGLRTMAQPKEI